MKKNEQQAVPAARALRAVALALPLLLAGCASGGGPAVQAAPLLAQDHAKWFKLPTEPYRGKQDDIVFTDARTGYYVNGQGKIFKSTDGGQSWTMVLHKPGTYFRAIGFIDSQTGFAGNIGTEYFPGVTDTTPLYVTHDAGQSWTAVTGLSGPQVKGLCAIDVLKTSFVNAGNLGQRTILHAAGRVGGPAFMMRSLDGGASWKTMDLNASIAAITDVKFFDEMNGMVIGADDANIERSHAVVVTTRDGGQSWQRAYTSARPFELAWKLSFPSRNVGYVTVQDYNPDKSVTQRVLAKTVDGGKSWQDIALADDFAVREFGVGFADDNTGWVGTTTSGFETHDGGKSWARVDLGRYINKIRIVPDGAHYVGYAVGMDVFKFGTPAPGTASAAPAAAAPAIAKP
jgi:photosystem II stability/assembly factor-like uncharacterized protein